MDTLRNRTQGFTIVKNGILKDVKMNMRDRGMYATLCSLPDGWELSVKGLTMILPDGKAAIASSLNSLEKNGYLVRREGKARGRITGTEWEITMPDAGKEETQPEEGNAVLINHTQGITIVKNNIIRNQELSLKDRGLLVTLLGLPSGWRMSIEGLASMLPDGRYAVGKSLQLLEQCGYLKRKQLREQDGTWAGSIWEVFDEPYIEEKEEEMQQERHRKHPERHEITIKKPILQKQRTDNPVREILKADKTEKEKEDADDSS